MAVLAEFVLQARTFEIGRTFAGLPGVEVEPERVVPLGDAVVPYAWIRGPPPEAVRQHLCSHEAVRVARPIDSLPKQGHLFRVEWDRTVEDALTAVADLDLVLLTGEGNAREWRLEFRAERRGSVHAFRRFCRDRGIESDLVRLTELSDREPWQRYRLTWPQYEALALAFERGYFEEPRRATLEDLATELGVSRQSVAGRLRRAHRNLAGWLLSGTPDVPVEGGTTLHSQGEG